MFIMTVWTKEIFGKTLPDKKLILELNPSVKLVDTALWSFQLLSSIVQAQKDVHADEI